MYIMTVMATVEPNVDRNRTKMILNRIPIDSPVDHIVLDSRMAVTLIMRQHPVFIFRMESLRTALQAVLNKLHQAMMLTINLNVGWVTPDLFTGTQSLDINVFLKFRETILNEQSRLLGKVIDNARYDLHRFKSVFLDI